MLTNVYHGKKVLVFGHTGFKGSWLTSWLLRLGANVAGFSNGIPTSPSLFEVLDLASNIRDYRGDVRDYEKVQEVVNEFSPDIIFHLAAKAIVRECLDNPVSAFHTNLLGTVHVLDAIRSCNSVQSAVIITSDKCYENVEWEYGYREDDRLGGKDPYSASKASAELAFSSYYRSYLIHQKPRLHIYTARAGNVIGGGDWARDRIIPDCMRAWYQGSSAEIRSPEATRPWQHVLEPLSGYLTLGAWKYLTKKIDLSGHSFNFGPSSEVNQSVRELILEMQQSWKFSDPTQVSFYTPEAFQRESMKTSKEATLLKLCCDKSFSKLQWKPTLNFRETVAMTVNWYKEFKNTPSKIACFTQNQIEEYQKLAKERDIFWNLE
ncbi:MAG: CDP-glucose 4,6-dehydratase [Oligoflexia bacterium]|nr:CDP-glucose 4,6-dehydratase [Oligoflexia bacterium]